MLPEKQPEQYRIAVRMTRQVSSHITAPLEFRGLAYVNIGLCRQHTVIQKYGGITSNKTQTFKAQNNCGQASCTKNPDLA